MGSNRLISYNVYYVKYNTPDNNFIIILHLPNINNLYKYNT